MIILDTSFIVSFLNRKDVHHPRALELLNDLDETEQLATHPLVLQETVTVIARKCKEQNGNCREWLDKVHGFMSSLKIMEFSVETEEVLDIMVKAECELSYVDAVLVLANKHTRAPLFTFDRTLMAFCHGD